MLLHISVVPALLKALALQGEGFLVSGLLRETVLVPHLTRSERGTRLPALIHSGIIPGVAVPIPGFPGVFVPFKV
ncbi:hypothetical protein GCM10007897_08620 [Sphingobium jiangsuense]|nr:hypothetical protein GCM10007897_08620 [Sphingobium jiangsuense]